MVWWWIPAAVKGAKTAGTVAKTAAAATKAGKVVATVGKVAKAAKAGEAITPIIKAAAKDVGKSLLMDAVAGGGGAQAGQGKGGQGKGITPPTTGDDSQPALDPSMFDPLLGSKTPGMEQGGNPPQFPLQAYMMGGRQSPVPWGTVEPKEIPQAGPSGQPIGGRPPTGINPDIYGPQTATPVPGLYPPTGRGYERLQNRPEPFEPGTPAMAQDRAPGISPNAQYLLDAGRQPAGIQSPEPTTSDPNNPWGYGSTTPVYSDYPQQPYDVTLDNLVGMPPGTSMYPGGPLKGTTETEAPLGMWEGGPPHHPMTQAYDNAQMNKGGGGIAGPGGQTLEPMSISGGNAQVPNNYETFARGKAGQDETPPPAEPDPNMFMQLLSNMPGNTLPGIIGNTYMQRFERKQKMRDLGVNLSLDAMKLVKDETGMKEFLADKSLTQSLIQRFPNIEDKEDLKEMLTLQIERGVDFSDMLSMAQKGLITEPSAPGSVPFEYQGQQYGMKANQPRVQDQFPDTAGTPIGDELLNSPVGLKEISFQNEKRRQKDPVYRFVALNGEMRVYQTNQKDMYGNFIPVDLDKPLSSVKDSRFKASNMALEKMKLTQPEADDKGVLHEAGTEVTYFIDKTTQKKTGAMYFDKGRRTNIMEFIASAMMGDMFTEDMSMPSGEVTDEQKEAEMHEKRVIEMLSPYK